MRIEDTAASKIDQEAAQLIIDRLNKVKYCVRIEGDEEVIDHSLALAAKRLAHTVMLNAQIRLEEQAEPA